MFGIQGLLKYPRMERQTEHSKLSVRMWVSTVLGLSIRRVSTVYIDELH